MRYKNVIGERGKNFIGKHGLYSVDEKTGRICQFVFGSPLCDMMSKQPDKYFGYAMMDKTSKKNRKEIKEQYGQLVLCIADRIRGKTRHCTATNFCNAFMDEMNSPEHDYLLRDMIELDMMPIFLIDVAGELDIRFGMACGKDGLIRIVGSDYEAEGGGQTAIKHVAYEITNRTIRKIELDSDENRRFLDKTAPIYGKAQMQAALCVIKARMMPHGKAIGLYEAALGLCPEDTDARIGYARLKHLGDKNYNAAIYEANIALLLDPCNSDAYDLMGIALYLQGNYGRAIATYETALDKTTRNDEGKYLARMAEIYLTAYGNPSTALKYCNDAIESDGSNPDWFMLRSTIYAELGMDDAKERDYQRYVALSMQQKTGRAEGHSNA